MSDLQPQERDKRASLAAALRLTLAAKRPRRATDSPRMTIPAMRPRRAIRTPEKGARK